MAKTARDDPSTPRRVRFDMRALRRLAAWGGCAALSLTLAVLAASSEPGSQRLAALGAGKATPTRSAVATAAQPTQSDAEARRLAEAVRILAADRDRMLARINSLQQNLDDVTGAINRPNPPGAAGPPPAAATPAPAPAKPLNPNVAATAPQVLPSTEPSEPLPPHRSAAVAPFPNWAATTPLLGVSSPDEDDGPPAWPNDADSDGLTAGIGAERSVLTKTEFGADIGGAVNIGALKSLWAAAKTTYAPLLERLRPVIAVREVRPGSVELRLIVGPLANAGAAARLCAALAANGRSCHPAVFDGQRLALR